MLFCDSLEALESNCVHNSKGAPSEAREEGALGE